MFSKALVPIAGYTATAAGARYVEPVRATYGHLPIDYEIETVAARLYINIALSGNPTPLSSARAQASRIWHGGDLTIALRAIETEARDRGSAAQALNGESR